MTEIARIRTAAETGLGALFDRLKGGLPGDVAVREEALAGFTALGLPHRRVEEFKYTDLRSLMREAAPLAERPVADAFTRADATAHAFETLPAARITLVNGYAGAIVGMPAGIEVVSLHDALTRRDPVLRELGSTALARTNPVYQLNTAFMTDGVVLRVPAGVAVDGPVHLRFVAVGASAFATASRVLVVVEAGASLTLVESHEGPDALGYQTNVATEFVVGDGATLRHVRLNGEGNAALALSTVTAKLGADVTFETMSVVTGSAAARHQVFATFTGENTSARFDGANLLKGRQHADATLVLDHAVPHCTSREMWKSILDDESTGVFQGKIIVRPGAQKTDGGMKSAALLLGEGASMYNKPELEIFADDVVCGHGATCGALDEDLLFYLRSRGLPPAEAESLLVQAFVGEALEFVSDELIREGLVAVLETWLAARAAAAR